MFELFSSNPGAAVAGLVALTCLTIWPLFKTRSSMLAVQLGAGLGFASHYWLLGLAAPSLVNVLGSVQTGAALFSEKSKFVNNIGYALIPLMVLVGFHFWMGPVSLLCVTASALIAFGRMQTNQLALRGLILFGCVLWIVHDYLVGSWIALTADIFSFILGSIAIWQIMDIKVGEIFRTSKAKELSFPNEAQTA